MTADIALLNVPTPSLASQLLQGGMACTKIVFAIDFCGSWLASDERYRGEPEGIRASNL
jgi:hypothetical protein